MPRVIMGRTAIGETLVHVADLPNYMVLSSARCAVCDRPLPYPHDTRVGWSHNGGLDLWGSLNYRCPPCTQLELV